jgi:hypothetical protein
MPQENVEFVRQAIEAFNGGARGGLSRAAGVDLSHGSGGLRRGHLSRLADVAELLLGHGSDVTVTHAVP